MELSPDELEEEFNRYFRDVRLSQDIDSPRATDPSASAASAPVASNRASPSEAVEMPTDKSAGSITETIDWWELEYRDLSEQLMCPICRTAFVGPVTTPCGHTFCRKCIEATRNLAIDNEQTFTCPIDRGPIPDMRLEASPFLIYGLVNDLIVKCPFASRGCLFEDKRCKLEGHVKEECGYVNVHCHPPCEDVVQRRHFLESGCRHALRDCPNDCGVQVSELEMQAHLEDSCQESPVICSACEMEMKRKTTKDHHQECDMATVVCPGKSAGCTWGGVRRELLTSVEEHASVCPLAKVAPILAAQTSRISTLESQNHALHAHIDALKRQIQREAAQLDMHLLTEYERLRRELDNTHATAEGSAKQVLMLTRENAHMTEDMAFLRSSISGLRHQFYLLSLVHRRNFPSFPGGPMFERPTPGFAMNSPPADRAPPSSDMRHQDLKL